MNFLQKFKCYMFFYDNQILNSKLAPNWFTNVQVIEITPNPGLSGTGPLLKIIYLLIGKKVEGSLSKHLCM